MAWASADRRASPTARWFVAMKPCQTKHCKRSAANSAKKFSRMRSMMITTVRVRRCGRTSPYRCCRRPTGADKACIRAAMSKASCAPRPRTNGWKPTASSTGPIFTPTMGANCKSGFLIFTSRVRLTAGINNPRCNCRCVTSTNSSSAMKTNGPSLARNGRSCICIQRITRCGARPRSLTPRSPTTRWAKASRSCPRHSKPKPKSPAP